MQPISYHADMAHKDIPQNPFTHGRIVSGGQFTDRVGEMERITRVLRGRNNLLIVGDRRIGKTSLIHVVMKKLSREGHECFYINLDPITSTRAFVERYAALFTTHASFGKRAGELVNRLIKGLRLETAFSGDGTPIFGLKWGIPSPPRPSDVAQALALPVDLSRKARRPWIIVLDEFQNVSQFKGDANVVAEMRSAIQGHRNINYVFMGSERATLERLFSSADEKFFNSVRKDEPVRCEIHRPVELLDDIGPDDAVYGEFGCQVADLDFDMLEERIAD